MKTPFELIEKYIEGDIDPNTKIYVENLIAKDKEFEKEYLFQLELNNAIQEKEVISLRENLNQIYANKHNIVSGTIIKLVSKQWHLVAASISILLVVGSFLLNNQNSSNTNDLFDNYYFTENAILLTRTSNTGFSENLKLALQQYEQKEFDSAIILLGEINDNLVADFYLGLAYVEVKSYSKASELFNRILDQDSNLFEEQAEWYNGLCNLQLGKRNVAIDIFKNIQEGNSLYKKDATKILKEMK